MKMYRQGDVLLIEIKEDQLPKEAKQKDTILAYGETTGHKHQIFGADVMIESDNQYMVVKQKAELRHEEHQTLQIPKGTYKVIHQREYNPQENRKVMD